MAFTDRKLQCRDCPDEFVFTAGEQEFYASKGLEHDPVRCPNCRQQRKSSSGLESNDTPRYGVYASYGGRTPRQLFVAECGQCKKLTEVPFRPRDDRPVLCSDCYGEQRKRDEAAAAAEENAAVPVGASSFSPEIVPQVRRFSRQVVEFRLGSWLHIASK